METKGDSACVGVGKNMRAYPVLVHDLHRFIHVMGAALLARKLGGSDSALRVQSHRRHESFGLDCQDGYIS
ncbi:MAG: hypothetical protein Kow00106_22640 [Anaerolineae bacterium]